jgi:hypothetical protein
MAIFGKPKRDVPQLDRQDSLSAKPVLNRLVKLERAEDGNIILQVPRRDTAMARTVARVFGIPPYKRVALDELGTFVIELCDGQHTVREMVDKFSKRFKLNRREAEVSLSTFLRTLGRRSIIGLVIERRDARGR